jgi:aspartate/methionine/tyrosine aminotransferase
MHGLSSAHAENTLACEGVRHALGIIFDVLARSGTTVALPSDVYPVYWRLAERASLRVTAFETFPAFELHATLSRISNYGATVVLLPQPLKLHGRAWTEAEASVAEDWLHLVPARRIILDCVYGFGLPVSSLTKRLLDSGKVFLLDSLSKSWLHEQIFGVAIVPQRDLPRYARSFRSHSPSKAKLSVAHELLANYPEFPSRVRAELGGRRGKVLEQLARLHLPTLAAEQGYFVPIHASADRLLAKHSLITIPATVFGSGANGWAIASALPGAGSSS